LEALKVVLDVLATVEHCLALPTLSWVRLGRQGERLSFHNKHDGYSRSPGQGISSCRNLWFWASERGGAAFARMLKPPLKVRS